MSDIAATGQRVPPDIREEVLDTARGLWAVMTATGTAYLLDLDHRVVWRQGARENGIDHSLRRDSDALQLVYLGQCAVGAEMLTVVDLQVPGVDFTIRRSTPIVQIQRIDPSVWAKDGWVAVQPSLAVRSGPRVRDGAESPASERAALIDQELEAGS